MDLEWAYENNASSIDSKFHRIIFGNISRKASSLTVFNDNINAVAKLRPNNPGQSDLIKKYASRGIWDKIKVVIFGVLRHFITFAIGRDGTYKNQFMMDILSEIWATAKI